MADYINREVLQTMIKELKREGYDEYMFGSNYTVLDAVENAVKKLLSVDAVEVVRCRDCKHSEGAFCQRFMKKIGEGTVLHCVKDDDFCKWGEKE